MKLRNTLIWLVIAADIMSYIWFFERKQMSTKEAEEKGARIFHIKSDDIDRIELKREGGDIVCVKDGAGEWQMERPLEYKADESQMRSICSRFESLKSERTIRRDEVDEEKLEEFGLKEPRLTALLHAKGRDLELRLGEDTPLGNSIYGQVSGKGDIYVLAKGIYSVLAENADDLRDKEVVHFEVDELSKVEFERKGGIIELTQENGTWRMQRPFEGLADPGKMSGILRKMKNLRVRKFVEDKPKALAKFKLDKPLYEVTLWDKRDGSSKKVLFGKEAEQDTVYAMRSGQDTVYTVSNGMLKDLNLNPEDLLDTQLTHLSQGNIKNVRVERGDKKLVLAKSGEKWEIEAPVKQDAEDSQVRKLLRAITELKIKEFVKNKPEAETLEKYGLGKDALTITLMPTAGEVEKIRVGVTFDKGKEVYVKRDREDEVIAVGSGFLKDVSLDPRAYMKKQVLDFNPDDVKKISIAMKGGSRVLCEKDGDKGWRMIEPERAEANKDIIGIIISNISKLQARKFMEAEPGDLKKYGLEEPLIEVAVGVESGGTQKTSTLLVGKEANGDTYYAKLQGEKTVFTIPSYIEKSLHKKLSAQK
jgi:hypothetical protein